MASPASWKASTAAALGAAKPMVPPLLDAGAPLPGVAMMKAGLSFPYRTQLHAQRRQNRIVEGHGGSDVVDPEEDVGKDAVA